MLYKELLILFLIQVIIFFLIKKKTSKYLIRLNLIDRPGNKKIHKKKIPITGGIICFFSLIFYILFDYIFINNSNLVTKVVLIFIFGISFTFFIGLIDDLLHLKVQNKIVLVTIFNILLFQNIIFFRTENLIFNNSYFDYEISISSIALIVSILGFSIYHYSLVIIDGIDGLFGSYTLSFLIIIFLFFDSNNQIKNFIFYLILIVSFLTIMNINKILFFGNSGSLMLATLLPYLILYMYNEKFNKLFFFEVITLIIIPVMDMTRLFFLRLFAKKNPFLKDLNHFHHLLFNNYNIYFSIIIYISICFLPFIAIKIGLNSIIAVIIQIVVFLLFIMSLKKKLLNKKNF